MITVVKQSESKAETVIPSLKIFLLVILTLALISIKPMKRLISFAITKIMIGIQV